MIRAHAMPYSASSFRSEKFLRQCLRNAVLGADPATRIRTTTTGVAILLMALAVGVVLLLVQSGFGYPVWGWWWAGINVAGAVLAFALVRSGWTQRLADPAMTQWQIWFAITSNAAGYVLLGQARGISPVMLSLVLMFGMFGLTPRQLAATLVYALLVFALAFGVVALLKEPGRSAALDLAYGMVVVAVLVGSTFVAVHVQRMRQRVARQKQELAQALGHIQHLATHDELTGLINRRRMGEILREEQARSARSQQPLALAMMDLDRFKRINDTEGHAMGDQVLRAFAQVVENTVRETDPFARWGGEEFVLLPIDGALDGVQALLERVRSRVQAQVATLAQCPQEVTVSIGVGTAAPGEPLELLLERADQALYRAKAQGRNQVVLHSAPFPAQNAP